MQTCESCGRPQLALFAAELGQDGPPFRICGPCSVTVKLWRMGRG